MKGEEQQIKEQLSEQTQLAKYTPWNFRIAQIRNSRDGSQKLKYRMGRRKGSRM